MMKREKQTLNHDRGNILLSLVAVILVTLIGLSLLGHVVTHQKIIGARQRRAARIEPVAQELTRHLHDVKQRALNADFQAMADPPAEFFNPSQFPDQHIEDIVISDRFSHSIHHFATYDAINMVNRAESVSTIHPYGFAAEMEIVLLRGEIPLSFIPVYLREKIDVSPSSYLEANGVSINALTQAIIDDSPTTFDTDAFLLGALQIQGRTLDWVSVRRKLGFDIVDEPIPDGIYFFQDESRISAVFVQGTLQKLVFHSRDDRQFILLRQGDVDYPLAYRPGHDLFIAWDPSIPDETGFDEKIIVNGDCLSLEQEGEVAFHPDSGIQLQVSGKTIITGSLVSDPERFSLKKTGWTHLTIIGGKHGLSGDSGSETAVIIENPQETLLELSLLINGEIINHSRNLILNGSLFGDSLKNSGLININHLCPQFNEDAYFLTKNATITHKIIINYIEEIANGYN